MLKVAISTLGCKVNQYESEELRQAFSAAGCEISDSLDGGADVCVINTCTVTAVSSRKSRKLIRKAVRENPKATIVATGCYAEAAPEEIAQIGGVDFIVGNKEKLKLPELVLGIPVDFSKLLPLKQGHTRALIKVQDGCDQFCSFCQIPYVRGGLHSRNPKEVIAEAERLVNKGAKEIVLTGIHLGKYGEDLPYSYSLADLLSQLLQISSLRRIRLSSIEAKEVDDRLISLFAASHKMCRHLHIPLQSGDNEILRKMNRNYSSEEYLSIVRNIREAIPDLAITTDIMVGFPGEGESEFRKTLAFAEEVGFAKIHVFNFSPRPGTVAAMLKSQIPYEERKKRVKTMMKVGEKLSQNYKRRFLGKTVEILVEERKNGFLTGLSDNYIRVNFEGPLEVIGEIVSVKLLELREGYILGKLLIPDF